MKTYLAFIFKYFFCWILFFLFQRILFCIPEIKNLSGIDFFSIISSFIHGLRFDVSSAGYASLLPFIALSVHAAGWMGFPKLFLKSWNFFVLLISSLTNVTDIALYKAWGCRINGFALMNLGSPAEIIASVNAGQLLLLILFTALQVYAGLLLFRKLLRKEKISAHRIFVMVMIPVFIFGSVIAIRGGFQNKPINKGHAYFSHHVVLNFTALNSFWNFLFTVTHGAGTENKYAVMPEEQAQRIRSEYFQSSGSTVQILSAAKPNIIFIQLESWSADVIGALGGEKDVTPFFNSLCREGLLLENFYSSGFRTEHGLVSVISGFPSQPRSSIIRDYGKFEKLPSLVRVLDSAGYYSASYFGGNLRFANMGPYKRAMGFKKVTGEDDFEYSGRTSWGAFDEDLFRFVAGDIGKIAQPFFAYIMTMTSHEPFTGAPGEPAFKGNSAAQNYRSSVHYTDRCLEKFFESIRHQAWYKNTLLIIFSDHGHKLPAGRNFNEAARFRIPGLIYGEALKQEFRGKKWEAFGSHQDIPALMLAQLGLPAKEFEWSKNIFSQSQFSFAYFAFEDGFGIISEKGQVIFDNELQKTITHSGEPDEKEKSEMLETGKAIQQLVQKQYLQY